MKSTFLKISALLMVIITIFALGSCKVKDPAPNPHAHVFGEYLSNGDASCTADGTKTAKCLYCTQTNTIVDNGSGGHRYSDDKLIDTTCETDGYKKTVCSRCNMAYEEILFTDGHFYDKWIDVDVATCTTEGKQIRVCKLCDESEIRTVPAKQHNYTMVSEVVDAGYEYKNYECQSCHDTRKLSADASASELYKDFVLLDRDNDFGFYVTSPLSESQLKQNIKIFDAYYEGSAYENSEEAVHPYTLTNEGGDKWKVTPAASEEGGEETYEDGKTYVIKLGDNVTFSDYEGNKITFSVEEPETQKIALRDDIIFLKTLESKSSGYYPYELVVSENSKYSYLMLNKTEGLEVGRVVCIGEVENLDDMLNSGDKDFSFGKIESIEKAVDGRYRVTMVLPELSEIYSEFDIHTNESINFEKLEFEFTENHKNAAVAALYESESFVKFLASVNVAAENFASDRNISLSAVTTASFMDLVKIDPDVKVDGNKALFVLKGEIKVPLKTKGGNEIGNIEIYFEASAELSIDVSVSGSIDHMFTENFDLQLTQKDKIGFRFGVKFGIDYTLADKEQNTNGAYICYTTKSGSKTLHIKECHIMSRDNLTEANKEEINQKELLNRYCNQGAEECKTCQPVTRFFNTRFVINANTQKVHITTCKDLKNSNLSNLEYTTASIEDLTKQGYSACGNCHPDRRDKLDFENQMLSSMKYSKWAEKVSEIEEWAKESDISAYSRKEYTIAAFSYPVSVITLNLDINLIFSFELSATLEYEYSVEHENTYGVRLGLSGVSTYKQLSTPEETSKIMAMGTVDIRAGVGVNAHISVVGLKRFARIGVTADVGIYGTAKGVIQHSFITDSGFKAGYIELGAFIDVEGYVKLLSIDKKLNIYEDKFPIIQYGYDKAYYAFVSIPEKIQINDVHFLDAEELLEVRYFDLTDMSDKTETLSFAGAKDQYAVALSLDHGAYCSIQNGQIVVNEDAPGRFNDKVIISIVGISSAKEYVKGNSIFYLDDIELPFVYYDGEYHEFAEISRTPSTCKLRGSITYRCLICGDEYTDLLEIAPHTVEIVDGKLPTCTEPGTMDGETCIVCKKQLTTQDSLDALGHSFTKYTTTKSATCTADGEEVSICDREGCSAMDVVAITSPGHNCLSYTDNGENHAGFCERCETDITEDHSYTDWFSFYISEVQMKVESRCCLKCLRVEYKNANSGSDGETFNADEFEEYLYKKVTGNEDSEGGFGGAGLSLHIHKNIVSVSGAEPNCTTAGYDYKIICTDCGMTIYKKERAALGHIMVRIDSGSGCVKRLECSRCGYEETSTNHNYDLIDYKPATCEIAGYKKYQCLKCGDVTKEGLKPSHSYVRNIDTAPTCANVGVEHVTCSKCDYSAYATLPKTDHKIQEHRVEPTCTAYGMIVRICSVCGYTDKDKLTPLGHSIIVTYDSQNHEKACSRCGIVFATGCHDLVTRTRATYTLLGGAYVRTILVQYECTGFGGRCGYTQEISRTLLNDYAPGGDFGGGNGGSGTGNGSWNDDSVSQNYITEIIAPTCTEEGSAIIRDAATGEEVDRKTIKALGHAPITTYDDVKHKQVCMRCDELLVEEVHAYVVEFESTKSITETHAYYTQRYFRRCRSLGNACTHEIEITSETISIPLPTNSALPSNPGIQYIYDVTDPTCTEDGIFILKNAANGAEISRTTITALGHSFTNYVYCGATCEEDELNAAKCDRCDAVDKQIITSGTAFGHSFTNYVSNNNASCTADGTKTAKCDRCDATDTVIDEDTAFGHSFTNYVPDNNATCTADGTKTARCDNGCGETDAVTIPDTATGHSFTNYVPDGNATCLADGTKTARCDNNCAETHVAADVGSARGHSFTNYVPDGNATCLADGTKTAKCNRCDVKDIITDTGSALDHSFTNYVSDNNASCTADGTKTAKCDRCPETKTLDDIGSKKPHTYTASGYDDIEHWGNCDAGGELIKESHIYGDDDICDKCSYREKKLEFTLSEDGNYYTVTGIGTEDKTDIVIPASYKNLPVTEIGAQAFEWCNTITSITIPATITSIGDDAFTECTGLKAVNITDLDSWCNIYFGTDESNPIIKAKNLYLNGTLVTDIEITESVGEFAFTGCTSLKNVTISGSASTIGYGAFSNCTSLESVVISEGVGSIEETVFFNCTSLETVTIPTTVISMGNASFYRCSSLATINYNGDTAGWEAITKGSDWDTSSGNYTVVCKDGSISKS